MPVGQMKIKNPEGYSGFLFYLKDVILLNSLQL